MFAEKNNKDSFRWKENKKSKEKINGPSLKQYAIKKQMYISHLYILLYYICFSDPLRLLGRGWLKKIIISNVWE